MLIGMDAPTPEPQQESPSEQPESETTPKRQAPRNCLDFDDLKTYVYLSRIADRWFHADDKEKAEWRRTDEDQHDRASDPAVVMADFGGGAAFFYSGSVPDCEAFALRRIANILDQAEPLAEYERVFVCENGEEGYNIREATYDGGLQGLAPTHLVTAREYPELDDKPAARAAVLEPDEPAKPLSCIGMSDLATCDHILPTVEHWFHMPAQQRRSWKIDDLGQAIVVIDFGGGAAYFKHGTLDTCEAYAVGQKTKRRWHKAPPFADTEARVFICEQADVGYILREVKNGGESVSLHENQIVPTAADRGLPHLSDDALSPAVQAAPDAPIAPESNRMSGPASDQESGPKPALSDPDDLGEATDSPSQPEHPSLSD